MKSHFLKCEITGINTQVKKRTLPAAGNVLCVLLDVCGRGGEMLR